MSINQTLRNAWKHADTVHNFANFPPRKGYESTHTASTSMTRTAAFFLASRRQNWLQATGSTHTKFVSQERSQRHYERFCKGFTVSLTQLGKVQDLLRNSIHISKSGYQILGNHKWSAKVRPNAYAHACTYPLLLTYFQKNSIPPCGTSHQEQFFPLPAETFPLALSGERCSKMRKTETEQPRYLVLLYSKCDMSVCLGFLGSFFAICLAKGFSLFIWAILSFLFKNIRFQFVVHIAQGPLQLGKSPIPRKQLSGQLLLSATSLLMCGQQQDKKPVNKYAVGR